MAIAFELKCDQPGKAQRLLDPMHGQPIIQKWKETVDAATRAQKD